MVRRLPPLLLPCLALLLAWLWFFWRFAAPHPDDRVTYPDGDFTRQFWVFRDVAYRAVLEGHLPLWAECLNSGYPFHADPQSQLWYPPAWLTLAALRVTGWGHFPIEALVLETALHYLLVSFGLFFFLRGAQALRPWAAALGALIFTYGGYLTGFPPLQTAVLDTAAWLPLALLCAARLADTRRRSWLAALALTLTVAFTAGHPQTFVYAAGLTLAYSAHRARRAGWGWAGLTGMLAAAVALTTALAGVQLLPSAYLILHSTRAGLDYAQAGQGLPLRDGLQFFLTGFASYWHPLYVGLLPLALAAFALRRRSAETVFWGAAAGAGLLLSFGAAAVVYDLARWLIPGYSLFRGQERMALLVSLSLAVLAARGAHWLLGPLDRRARSWLDRLRRLAAQGMLLALGLLLAVSYLARLGVDPSDSQDLPGRVGMMTLAMGLAGLALALRQYVPGLRHALPAVLAGCVSMDLFMAARPLNVVPPFAAYPPTPLVEPIAAETDFFRVQDDLQLPGHAGCGYGFHAVDSITPYRVATYARFMESAPERVRWSVLGVRYLVTWRQWLGDLPDGTAVAAETPSAPGVPNQAGLTRVYRLGSIPVRRAFLASEVRTAADPEALLAALQDPAFDPSGVVILPEAAPAAPGSGEVRVEEDRPGELRLRVSTTAPAVLVVSEAYFPGWQARVDDQAARVLLADGAVLGVPLPDAGQHEVALSFRPTPLFAGGLFTAAGLIVCLWLMLRRG